MNQKYYLQLQAAKGVGPKTQHRVLDYISGNQLSLMEFITQSEADWVKSGLSVKQAEALRAAENLAQEWMDILSKKDIRVIGWLDKNYPEDLKLTLGQNAPPILSVWGNSNLLAQPAVGFSGARDATSRGINFTKEIARQSVSRSWVVISGHALGTDNAAHLAALENKGSTIIVAPTGILNFRLRSEIKERLKLEQVLIISEFQPNSQWSVGNAMKRNKTICGLSDALIIVEPGAAGGTFDAGKFALEKGIPLYVATAESPKENDHFFIEKGAGVIQPESETGSVLLEDLEKIVGEHFTKQKLQALSIPKQRTDKPKQPRLLQ